MTRKILVFITLLIILISCKNNRAPKIEKFIWIQDNLNWIWQPEDLKARYYLEYDYNSNNINFAHTVIVRKDDKILVDSIEYFKSKAPSDLDSLIYHYLFNNNFAQSYSLNKDSICLYHGDHYCIIYKFENQPERIIAYLPFTITDSLKVFTEKLESYKKLKSFERQKPFNTDYYIEKYRKIIVDGNPLAPRPWPDSLEKPKIKYITPNEMNK